MNNYLPLRELPPQITFKKGDVLVLFGELFNRGYANGLVEEAMLRGMTIVRATVGRRDENNKLRPLTDEESAAIPKPFINVPLEAGFDFETDDRGQSPNDYLKGVKLTEWTSVSLVEQSIQMSQKKGRTRFQQQARRFMVELERQIGPDLKEGNHVHFAHLMAGGVPRSKIVLPLLNRVFKGIGDRHLPSLDFWKSSIGQLVEKNFHEVSAETFNTMILESTELREKWIKKKITTSYVAYGYHGTEIIVNDNYRWQSYAPYLQGWAKVNLENYSKIWFEKGIRCCVFNCPEILTNSSSIFQGVEIPLYNLIRALTREEPNHPVTLKMIQDCKDKLKDPNDLQKIYALVDDFILYSESMGTSRYENWPQHSVKEQLEKTLSLSDFIMSLHKDDKDLLTGVLSEVIFKACGYVMLHEGFSPRQHMSWIGHDLVAKTLSCQSN